MSTRLAAPWPFDVVNRVCYTVSNESGEMNQMSIQILDEQVVQQLERIAQRERREQIEIIAQALRLYEEKMQGNGTKSFVLAIANLGSSGQGDVSERDEEILTSEVEPLHGWARTGDVR